MTVIENLAFLQRILNSAIEDLAVGGVGENGVKARGKMEILAGELAIFRDCFEEQQQQPIAFEEENIPVNEVVKGEVIDI